MKIQEVIDRILAYHPTIENYGTRLDRDCDGFKCGDPQQECTGIVSSVAAPMSVIRRAIELGANLIIVHEPTFYTHLDPTDWLEGDEVYEKKRALLDAHGIVVWRDHDHIHTHRPDGIFYGVAEELGWTQYAADKAPPTPMEFDLPKTTVRELALEIKERMNLQTLRVIGNLDAEVSRVGYAGMHMMDGDNETQKKHTLNFKNRNLDVMLTLEAVDWTLSSYVRDAGELGLPKALIMTGHMNGEELGMKWAVGWISELIGHAVPVTFVPSADLYQYV